MNGGKGRVSHTQVSNVALVAGKPLPHILGEEGDSPVGEQGVLFNGGTKQENYEGV